MVRLHLVLPSVLHDRAQGLKALLCDRQLALPDSSDGVKGQIHDEPVG